MEPEKKSALGMPEIAISLCGVLVAVCWFCFSTLRFAATYMGVSPRERKKEKWFGGFPLENHKRGVPSKHHTYILRSKPRGKNHALGPASFETMSGNGCVFLLK